MDSAAKQQIVDRVKQANNILVTVSTNPSVDQLAACIGLTLLLNRLGKHATAIFSGKLPSTIEFLQPEKTITGNTDTLRDFIISLDKDKADKLRYKVEDQVVKIFITPYKTSLSERDLVFSQGDFNVEVVMALGIADKAHMDAAITAHGRILHDAIVIAMNNGTSKAAALGQINWLDPEASSLCEMVVSMSEAFGSGLIDNQMATAFLTGIVAETDRFSNKKTSPKVMTMSAQLMAAGANQQLIVSKLEPPTPVIPKNTPVQVSVPHGPVIPAAPAPEDTEAKLLADGTMNIAHDVPKQADISSEIHIDEQGNLVSPTEIIATPKKEDLHPEVARPTIVPPVQAQPPAEVSPPPKTEVKIPGPHTLLDPKSYQPSMETAFTANTEPEWSDPYNSVSMDPLASRGQNGFSGHGEHTVQPPGQTLKPSNVDAPSVDSARSAVDNAIGASDPGENPNEDLNSSFTDLDKPAPPPGPPPLVLPSGPVIPNAPAKAKKAN